MAPHQRGKNASSKMVIPVDVPGKDSNEKLLISKRFSSRLDEEPGTQAKKKNKAAVASFEFGFDVVKLSDNDTKKATKLMQKEFIKDGGLMGRRMQKIAQQDSKIKTSLNEVDFS